MLNLSTNPAVTSNTYLALSPDTPFSLHATTSIVVSHNGTFFSIATTFAFSSNQIISN